MKHQWLAYVIVAALSIGAGVAIAGFPDNSPAAATPNPTSTVAVDTTTPETTVADTVATTEATTTLPETTVPETTVPETTVPETTTPETTAPADLPDRSELFVVAANGSNVAGAAARMAERLEGIGYVDVALRNGTTFSEFTTIYYVDGFEDSALRLADDLDVVPEFVGPLADAPNVTDLPDDVELLVYIGLDRA